MLKIRLARGGRKKAPFYRIVLTEHTKPAQSGYKEVLGWFNPLRHEMEMNIDQIKEWIGKGAQPSNRVAKLALQYSSDSFFEKYIEKTERKRRKKNAPEEEEVPAEEAAPVEKEKTEEPAAEEAKEEVKEETTDESSDEENEEPKSDA